MTGLDTNVLLAWLLRGQARELPSTGPFRISLVVLAELAWVLSRSLRRREDEIVTVLRMVADTESFRFADRESLVRAIDDYAAGGADFADYLLMRDNFAAGCPKTLTLDRKAARHPGFSPLGSM